MVTTLLLLALSQTPADAPLAVPTEPAAQAAAPATVEKPRNVVRARAIVPTIVGSVLVVGGAVFLAVGETQYNTAATNGNLTPEEIESQKSNATSNVVGGTAAMIAGGAIVGLSLIMWLWEPEPSPSKPTVAIVPLKDGAGVFAKVALP